MESNKGFFVVQVFLLGSRQETQLIGRYIEVGFKHKAP